MPKTFVIGDIHGAYRALRQCLGRSAFDYATDRLICLGDICDGWPETKEAIDELLKIKNRVCILGNHDYWTLDWMLTGRREEVWLHQGGEATIQSYADGVPPAHTWLLKNAVPWHLQNNRLFVHAGIDPTSPLHLQSSEIFLWDRNLARIALDFYFAGIETRLTTYDEIYIGHTPIPFEKPIWSGGVCLMDTGAGWTGVLSMMDINTHEVFTSDKVPALYPGVAGRVRNSD